MPAGHLPTGSFAARLAAANDTRDPARHRASDHNLMLTRPMRDYLTAFDAWLADPSDTNLRLRCLTFAALRPAAPVDVIACGD